MDTKSLVIQQGNFMLKVITNGSTSELHLECIYVYEKHFWSWDRMMTRDTKFRTSSTTEVSVNLKKLWNAFRDYDNGSEQDNICFPIDVTDFHNYLIIHVYTKKDEGRLKNNIKLFPRTFFMDVNLKKQFDLTLEPYLKKFEANRMFEHVYNEKLQALERSYNAKLIASEKKQNEKIQGLVKKHEEQLQKLLSTYERMLESKRTENLNEPIQYKDKILNLEKSNNTMNKTLQATIPLVCNNTMLIKTIYEQLSSTESDDVIETIPRQTYTTEYSGLLMIPIKVVDIDRGAFFRNKCSEAVYEMPDKRIVLNYCEWLGQEIVTSFHIHICFSDEKVKSGMYIDASDPRNFIKPRTIFHNFVNKYGLSVTGDAFLEIPPNEVEFIRGAHVKIEIPEKDSTDISIDHEVYFYELDKSVKLRDPSREPNIDFDDSEKGCCKNYQIRIALDDDPDIMIFADIQGAIDKIDEPNSLNETEDTVYIIAQLNSSFPTKFVD